MFRSCKRNLAPRSRASITKSFLSMTVQPIGRSSESKSRRMCACSVLKGTSVKAPQSTPGSSAARGATLVLIDGDLQNDPADIPRLLDEIARGADLVCGYRAQRRDTVVKRLTSRIANTIRSRYTKDGVRDTGCTLKAMRRECVTALLPFKGMHRFIPALVKGAGYGLIEIPVNHRPRRFGQTKYSLGNRAVRATVDMFGVRWLLSRRLNYKVRDQSDA